MSEMSLPHSKAKNQEREEREKFTEKRGQNFQGIIMHKDKEPPSPGFLFAKHFFSMICFYVRSSILNERNTFLRWESHMAQAAASELCDLGYDL